MRSSLRGPPAGPFLASRPCTGLPGPSPRWNLEDGLDEQTHLHRALCRSPSPGGQGCVRGCSGPHNVDTDRGGRGLKRCFQGESQATFSSSSVFNSVAEPIGRSGLTGTSCCREEASPAPQLDFLLFAAKCIPIQAPGLRLSKHNGRQGLEGPLEVFQRMGLS